MFKKKCKHYFSPREGDPHVKDFGSSWRNGNAFLALVRNLVCERCEPEPGDVIQVLQASLRQEDSKKKLQQAFHVAEDELGVTRLLEPEGLYCLRIFLMKDAEGLFVCLLDPGT
jgi:hypothetical protein